MAAPRRKPDPARATPHAIDFHRWCDEQVELLRHRRFGEADVPNIIEELQAMVRSDTRALRSSYRLALMHLLKWRYRPSKRSPSWDTTIDRERDVIDDIEAESPSLRAQSLSYVAGAYPRARRDAAKETGLPLATFPETCPFSLDDLRNPDWLPE
jgi:hypothetical protein